MASWFGGLSSSVGCYLEQMSHSVVSLTRHISRCTKAVWITEYETEESNELRRKEVETTKETVRPEDERFVTFYSDLDLEYKQQTAAYNDLLIKGDLDKNVFIGKEIRITQKLQNLQKDTQCVNAATGFVPATSSTSLGENIDPKASEYEHELEQQNLEMKILRGRNVAMKHKLLKLQKATESVNAAAGFVPATSASISLGDNIDPKASEYKHQLEQQNLEMKILRERHGAMKRKLFKLQNATECLNAAAGILPATSSASLGENIDPNATEYEHELEQKNLEIKILRGRNVAMKHKLLKLGKATECLNMAAGLLPATSSASLGDNIVPNVSEYKNQLEQKNIEMKILRGRNVAMKHKLLKLQKATKCLNMAAGLVPATSSTSLGENINPNASEHKREVEQKTVEMKILREKHEVMKRKLLKLQNANQSTNVAAGLQPAMPALTSLGDNIDHKASEYEHELEQQNLEMKILRGRNVAMKHKLLKLQKATECLNMAAGLLPATSSASLGENIDPNASEHEHDLKQRNLEMKILRGKNVAMKYKLLKLQKAIQCLNAAVGLVPATSSTSLGQNTEPNASERKQELEEKHLEVKILRGRNVAMKHKLLKLRKATQCLNAAAGLQPAMPALTSLGDNIDHNASEYEHQLKQQNLEMKILRGRNVAMKHELLKLLKATECLNVAAGLLPATSSTSLGENIDPKASEYKHELEQKNLEMKILRERHEAMKRKLLKLQNANQSINVAPGLVPATSPSTSLGDNIDHNVSEYKNQLEQQNLEMKTLRGRNAAMKYKLLKLQKAIECLNAAARLLPETTSTSMDENIDPKASEHKHELEQKNLEVKILRGRNVAMKHKLLKLGKATECLNMAAGLLPATSSASLGDNIVPNVSEYKNQLEQKNIEMKILRGRNVAMKHKLLKLQRATQCLNMAAGFIPATSSTSLGENINPNASEHKREVEQKTVEMKILREKHEVMKRKLLKLQNANQSTNVAAGLQPAMPALTSLGDNIDHKASEYEHELEQQNLEMKILRGRNVAMKHKLLKLQKATECLNMAAGLLPATSSASLGENIDPNASEHEHDLKQRNLEMKILRGKNVAMKYKLLKLQKAIQCLNAAVGLVPATSSTSLGQNTEPNASERKQELEEKHLEVKILRGRNVAMKHKLLKLRKATQCLNAAAGLQPAMPALTSLGDNIDHNASEYEHQLKQQNLEMKILRGRNVAMKHELLKLLKATECLNVAAGLLPATSSTSLGENIDPKASEYKHELEQKNLEMKILRERHEAMKRKLLKLQNANQSINVAPGLVPATSPSTSLGDNIDHNVSEYKNQLEQQNLEMKTLRGRNAAMKYKLLKLQKAIECLNAAARLLPETTSTSMDENIDPKASEHKHELEQKNLEVKILRGRNVAMKHKLLKLGKATQCLNAAAGLVPAMPTLTSLGDNIDHNASEYKNQLEQKNLEMKILRGRNVAMKHKLLKLQKAIQCLNVAAGLVPATSSTSLGENTDPSASERKHYLEEKNLKMKILREGHTAMKSKLLKLQNANQSINAAAGLVPAMPASTSLGDNIDHNASENHHQLELKNITYHASSIFQHLPEQNDLVDLVKSISNVF